MIHLKGSVNPKHEWWRFRWTQKYLGMFAISRTLQLDEWYIDTYSIVMLAQEKLFQWYDLVLSGQFCFLKNILYEWIYSSGWQIYINMFYSMVKQILCLSAHACLNSLPNALAQIQMLRCSNYQVIFIVQMHLFIILSTVAFYPVLYFSSRFKKGWNNWWQNIAPSWK